ncbi:SRPBCC family protein [Aeromicrobium sp. CTD01-1L150]|uniref:SRPBCC family protein n=1 Tax=Aeromicrobium sp. CTD01-1L150 TaxID=3341830 RepID=UPI0035C0FE1A
MSPDRPYEALLEHAVDIGAPPAQVWPLVSDVCRMPEWSPQVVSVRLRPGFDRVQRGAQFTNLNRLGELEWATHGEIVRFTEEREVAFRIAENRVIWSFALESVAPDRTRLTQRRETPDGISDFSLDLTDTHLGGQAEYTAVLRDSMEQTLARIKVAAEA